MCSESPCKVVQATFCLLIAPCIDLQGLNLGAVGAATIRGGFIPVNDKMQVTRAHLCDNSGPGLRNTLARIRNHFPATCGPP